MMGLTMHERATINPSNTHNAKPYASPDQVNTISTASLGLRAAGPLNISIILLNFPDNSKSAKKASIFPHSLL